MTTEERILYEAKDAVQSGWSFEKYLRVCKEAWIVAHQEALDYAKQCVYTSEKEPR